MKISKFIIAMILHSGYFEFKNDDDSINEKLFLILAEVCPLLNNEISID